MLWVLMLCSATSLLATHVYQQSRAEHEDLAVMVKHDYFFKLQCFIFLVRTNESIHITIANPFMYVRRKEKKHIGQYIRFFKSPNVGIGLKNPISSRL